MKLTLGGDSKGKGNIAFRGIYRKDNELISTLNREIDFNYFIERSTLYMQDISTRKHITDTLADNVFNTLVMDTTKEKMFLNIKQKDNLYFIHRNFSPPAICVEKDI
ncbi:hypothetical protein UXO11_22260 [Enterobacter wuhouensis]|uniref:hypothetical protein n=1 Tax=Enterobacter wuhouensis TaxID=2529381 RepID=UPI002FD2B5F2